MDGIALSFRDFFIARLTTAGIFRGKVYCLPGPAGAGLLRPAQRHRLPGVPAGREAGVRLPNILSMWSRSVSRCRMSAADLESAGGIERPQGNGAGHRRRGERHHLLWRQDQRPERQHGDAEHTSRKKAVATLMAGPGHHLGRRTIGRASRSGFLRQHARRKTAPAFAGRVCIPDFEQGCWRSRTLARESLLELDDFMSRKRSHSSRSSKVSLRSMRT